MTWCPKCKAEYREGFSVCSDCQIELVENIDSQEKSGITIIDIFHIGFFAILLMMISVINTIYFIKNSNIPLSEFKDKYFYGLIFALPPFILGVVYSLTFRKLFKYRIIIFLVVFFGSVGVSVITYIMIFLSEFIEFFANF